MCKKLSRKIKNILRFVSLGKYNQGLYYRGKTSYSSVYGGMLSIIIGIALLIYSMFILRPVFVGSSVEITTSAINITDTNYQSINLQEFNSNFNKYQALVQNSVDKRSEICSNITLNITTAKAIIGPFKFKYENNLLGNLHICTFDQQNDTDYANKSTQMANTQAIQTLFGELKCAMYITIENSYNESNSTIQSISLSFQSTKISSNSIYTGKDSLVMEKRINRLGVTLLSINQTDSMVGIFAKFKESFSISSIKKVLEQVQEGDLSYGIVFDVNNVADYVEISNYNLITAFSKIGGILAIVKVISTMISFIHQKLFERKINKELRSSETLPSLSERQPNNVINQTERSETSTVQDETNSSDRSSLLGTKEEKKQELIHEVYTYSNFQAMLKKLNEYDKDIESLKTQVEILKSSVAHNKYE